MALTPETLTRHELNGLYVRVVDAANPDLVGIAGRVVVETMQTLHVDCDVDVTETHRARDGEAVEREARVKVVPKRGTTLEFRLPRADAHDGDRPSSTNEVDGDRPSPTNEVDGDRPSPTNEAAGVRKALGTAFKRRSETAGIPGQSDPCEGVAYVTVDGDRLLSRPALRTEKAGDSTWR